MRYDDIARAISMEWARRPGSPTRPGGDRVAHATQMIKVLKDYEFEQVQGKTLIAREPIGVCGFITPWNWPINQIMCKVAPALAAGCTMVLKPSEIAPLNAIILAEVLHAAGVPKGVFNLVNGDGPTVGAGDRGASRRRSRVVHRARPGRASLVAKAAADTVKRVTSGARREVGQYHPARCGLRQGGDATACRAASATAGSPATRRRACSFTPTSTMTRCGGRREAAEAVESR